MEILVMVAPSNRNSLSEQVLGRQMRKQALGVVEFSRHHSDNPGGRRGGDVWGSPAGPSADTGQRNIVNGFVMSTKLREKSGQRIVEDEMPLKRQGLPIAARH